MKIADIILLLWLGRKRSVVNVKQCSKRSHGDGREYGPVFVSTIVTLRVVTCVSMHLLSLFFAQNVIRNTCFVYTRGTLCHFPLLYHPSIQSTVKTKYLQQHPCTDKTNI